MPDEVGPPEVSDPTGLYRIRDGAYAADLLIAAVGVFDVFTWLAEYGPTPAAALRAAMGWTERPTDVLVTLAAAHGLVERDLDADDRVGATALAREHLSAGSPHDLRPYYASLAERPAVAELAAVLRTDRPASWASAPAVGGPDEVDHDWAGRLDDPAFARRITAAMDARGSVLGPPLAGAVADLPIERLLDIGGSSGVYAAALLATRPGARATVVERAPVDAAARTLLAERGLAERIDVATADMFTDPLPDGADAHLYSQVLHDWDAARVEHLFAASFAALEPGGVLFDHDAHLDPSRTGPLPVAEYSVLLMHSTPGRCWSTAELAEMATRVGFVDVAHRPTTADRGVLVARKPRSRRAGGGPSGR